MKIDQIKELAKILSEYGLSSLEITEDQTTVKLARQSFTPEGGTLPPSFAPLAGQKEPAGQTRPGCVTISSPVVGVYYSSPSPDAAPFVTAGNRVKKGDVLCIVEAMKLMNEVTSDREGTVVEICAQNEQVVEFGQPLFVLQVEP